MIDSESAPVTVALRGSLQQRRELVPGLRTNAFECTISVNDIQKAADAVVANGGTIVMPVCTLAGIGRLFFFQDPDGNQAGAMHDEAAQGVKKGDRRI